MGLFRPKEDKRRGRHDKLLHGLTKSTRLLLPTDPGRERMLDALRQYHPLARHGLLGGFHADGGSLNLIGPRAIEPEMAVAAHLPVDITTAYFTTWVAHPSRGVSRRESDQMYREKATYLLGGLAARFGGLSYPRPADAGGPLRADVYMRGDVNPQALVDLVSRHTPGRVPVRARSMQGAEMAAAMSRYLPRVKSMGVTSEWPDQGVTGLAGEGVPFGVEYWPVGPSTFPVSAEAIKGSDPMAVVAKILGPSKWSMLVVRTDVPAEGADPGLARAVGEAALGLAAETGGVPMDLFGFRIRDPADLIIRRG